MSGRSTPDIDWTIPGRHEFLRQQWNSGISAAKIALECTNHFHQFVSKNAIIGKAGRISAVEAGWCRRLSPIRRDEPPRAVPKPQPKIKPCGGAATLPELPSIHDLGISATPIPRPAIPNAKTSKVDSLSKSHRSARLPCEARSIDTPLRRRDGTGCLFPIGTPGSKGFRFCDDTLENILKPYCEDHRKMTSVKVPYYRRDDG